MQQPKRLFQFNQIFSSLIIFTFIVLSALWLVSYIVYKTTYRGNNCIASGYAHHESWIFSVIIYHDGYVQYKYFSQNLSNQDGLYVKLSGANTYHRYKNRTLFPIIKYTKLGNNITFHLALPLSILFVIISVYIIWPVIRRIRRRRKGLCIMCGYDLRGAISDQCSECGCSYRVADSD